MFLTYNKIFLNFKKVSYKSFLSHYHYFRKKIIISMISFNLKFHIKDILLIFLPSFLHYIYIFFIKKYNFKFLTNRVQFHFNASISFFDLHNVITKSQ